MKLVTIDAQPSARTGVILGDEVLDFALANPILPLAGWIPTSMVTLLTAGESGLDLIRRQLELVDRNKDNEVERLREKGALKPRAKVQLLAPVPQPGMILSHGRAYRSHLEEMARGENAKPEHAEVPKEPRAFLKNINAIVGPDGPIKLPRAFPDMVDFEGEFSVVLGRHCYNVDEKDALDAVVGYTIVNDVSARNWVEDYLKSGNPDYNRRGKQLPTFCPLGPAIATKDEVGDPHELSMTTTLNGKVMQSAHTSDLIWRIPYLISFLSRYYAFRPGDIMTTGSPSGVGYARNPKVFMRPGDVIAVSVDKVGTLSNPIVAA